MAKNVKKLLLSLHLFAEFLQLLLLVEAAESGGLTVKLIHRHSPDSPFYPGNITQTERIMLLVQAASSYATRLSSAQSSRIKLSTNTIRPKMGNQNLMYLVQVGIGTFTWRRYNYFLHLDTASDIMWTQCDECLKTDGRNRGSCFLQKPPLFPAKRSNTYRPLLCNRHPLCFKDRCLNGTCTYALKYIDRAETFGYLASESLTFDSDMKGSTTVRDVVFGCGIKNEGFTESSKDNMVAGNFGMGFGEHSFVKQKELLTLGRFSYCLPPWNVPRKLSTSLRFGADIPSTKGFKVTPLGTTPGIPMYFVNLEGISVGNRRVDIPSKMLKRSQGYGGCVVDLGCSFTIMPPFIYQKLKEMLITNHFRRYEKQRVQGPLDLCYRLSAKRGLKDLPSITFHLQDADLVFHPHLGFVTVDNSMFCLAMIPEDANGMIMVGAQQQAEKCLVFDTLKRKLYFRDDDCSHGAYFFRNSLIKT